MRKKSRQLNRKTLYRRILLILAGIGIFAMIIISNLRMIRTIYEERSTNTQILVEQVARNLDESLAKEMQFLEYCVNNFERSDFSTFKEAQEYLALVKETGRENIINLYLVDKDAYCYSSDEEEKVFRWRSTDVLASGEPRCFLSTVENTVLHPETAIFFVMPFKSTVVLEEAAMTHMVMEVSMDVVESYFDIAYYDGGNTSLILR